MKAIGELLREASDKLVDSDSAHLDAQILLAKVLDVDRVWLMTWSDKEVTTVQQADFLELVARRKAGEPIAYILGKREFWGRDFLCNEHTLIPRPDTERLVEMALSLDLPEEARVLDLGTGTGCIGLTLAAERPNWSLVVVDVSAEALKAAEANRLALNLDNARVLQSAWYAGVSPGSKFDLIVANPPYIDPVSPYLKEGDVRFEPDLALTSKSHGLHALEQVISGAPRYLNQGGWIAVEHGFDQAEPVGELLQSCSFIDIQQWRDLAGLDRVSAGRLVSQD